MVHLYNLIIFQLAVLQAELEKKKVENHQLKNMFDEAKMNYNTLNMHFMSLMQKGKVEDCNEEQLEEEKPNGNGGVLVPRQFIDLGLAANESHVVDEPRSQDQSKSVVSNNEEGFKDEELVLDHEKNEPNRGNDRNDSPSNQVLAANNSPQTSVEQAEATMRKARVSVRARSEANMVILFHILVRRMKFSFWILFDAKLYYFCLRSVMGVNGENTDRKWRKETRVLELIIGAPWP